MNAKFIAMTNQNAFIEVLLYVRYENSAIASEFWPLPCQTLMAVFTAKHPSFKSFRVIIGCQIFFKIFR